MKVNRIYAIGVLFLIASAILYYGLLFLRGQNPFSNYNTYRISYATNKNLSTSDPVKLNGHTVGRVTKVEILPDKDYSTLVSIEVDKRFPLTDKSKVMLNNATSIMTGSSTLELELHYGRPLTKQEIIPGQLHPSFHELDLKVLTTQFTMVMDNLIETTKGVNSILEYLGTTSQTLAITIDTIQPSINTIAKNVAAVSSLLADPAQGVHKTLRATHTALTTIQSIPFKDIACNLISTIDQIKSLLEQARSNQSTLGLLLHDPTLYHNLTQSTTNLSALLVDIRRRPFRYVNFSIWGRQREPKLLETMQDRKLQIKQ